VIAICRLESVQEATIKIVKRTKLLSCVLLTSVIAFTVGGVRAATLTVTVVDRDGKAVTDAVVAVQPAVTPASSHGTPAVAIMDQLNLQFVPWVLPVHTGTPVVFPNSDTVAHQVYSFSAAKHFSLGLYRGRQHAPIVFDQPGIVVLGCNIHDSMVGYIYVTDAPYFGNTDSRGTWQTAEPAAGQYRLQIWSPRLAASEPPPEQQLLITDAQTSVTVRLTSSLTPAPVLRPHDRKLRDY
jgi:plastocyanin